MSKSPDNNTIRELQEDTKQLEPNSLNIPSSPKTPKEPPALHLSLIQTIKKLRKAIAAQQPESKEVKREHEVLAIGDLEANYVALVEILRQAGYIKMATLQEAIRYGHPIKITEKGTQSIIVQTGDLFDRGTDLLLILKQLQILKKQGLNFRLLAGNHELYAISSLESEFVTNKDKSFFELVTRMINSIKDQPKPKRRATMDRLIEDELKKTQQSFTKSKELAAEVFTAWYIEGGYAVMQDIQEKYFPKESSVPLADIALKGQELLIAENGPFTDITRGLKAVEQIDDTLYLHAGIDNRWTKLIQSYGIEGVNKMLQAAIKNRQTGIFAYGKYKELFWKREAQISRFTAQILKSMGITTIIRGHVIQVSGEQSTTESNGILIVNNDIGINRRKPPRIGSITRRTDGQIIALHDNQPKKLL